MKTDYVLNDIIVKNIIFVLIEIIEKVSSNVFRIYININGQWTSGSGILLDEKGTIWTREHVVSSNQSNIEIYVRKEGGIPVKATLITTDKIRDLAIIKIDKSKIDYPIKFAKYGYIIIGQDCFVLEYPLGLSTLTLTKAVYLQKVKPCYPIFHLKCSRSIQE